MTLPRPGLCTCLTIALMSLLHMIQTCSRAETIVDTRAAGWIWHGMSEYDNPNLYGGVGYAGSSGTYGVYSFEGTQVAVYAMSAPFITVDGKRRRIGSLKVTIDGVEKANINLENNKTVYDDEIYSLRNMDDKAHILELVADGGWAVINYLRTDTTQPPASMADPDARLIVNRRSGLAVIGASVNDHVTDSEVDPANDNEKWLLKQSADDCWSIRNAKTKLALTADSQTQWVISTAYTGSPNQLWRIEPAGDGFDILVNKASGYALNVFDCSTYPGSWLNHSQYAVLACQQWTIREPVH